MKIFVYSVDASALFMVDRLQHEGHEVILYIDAEDSKKCYDNMVFKVDNPDDAIKMKPDFVFFDEITKGKTADKYKKMGIPVIGAGDYNDRMELDRTFGMDLMKKVGIKFPETTEFNSVNEAVAFIKKNPNRYVVKMNESQSNYASYVGKSPEDLINTLEHFRDENLIKEKSGFVLQEFIEGYEISTEGWFNGTGFVPGAFNHCIEEKKFLTGNLGPTTGSEGSVVFRAEDDSPLVANIARMTPILAKEGYKGALDLNTIVDKSGVPYALEFCPRTGYVCFENFIHLYDGDFGDFLHALALGEDFYAELSTDLCIGVRLSVPPYPQSDLPDSIPPQIMKTIEKYLGRRSINMRVLNWEKIAENCFLTGVYLNENNELRIATNDGIVGSMCARGKSIKAVQKDVYEKLKTIDIPDKQYRTDIGDRYAEWPSISEKIDRRMA